MQRRVTLENSIYFCFFETLSDPRSRNRWHPLHTVVFCVLVAVICGADGFVQAEQIAKLKRKFIERYVPLPHGIPTHDTMARVFAALDPENFLEAFILFMSRISQMPKDDIINIDGKTLRAAVNKLSQKQAAAEDQVHMVSAFSAVRGVVIGQLRSAAVANEVAAAQELLRLVMVNGCTVTMDAAHMCRKTLEMVRERGANVVVGVKANSGKLLKGIIAAFKRGSTTVVDETEHAHGRIERRRYVITAATGEAVEDSYPMLKVFVRTERQRIHPTGKIRKPAVTYYATSLGLEQVDRIVECIRRRWAIENELHHLLDVAFHEDKCRVLTKNAPENLARIRHLALGLLKQDESHKVGIALRRILACGDDAFLARVMQLEPGSA